MKLTDLLVGFAPRHDHDQPFYPERAAGHSPAMLNSMNLISTTTVAAKVMHGITARRGTRVKPAMIEKLVQVLENTLPEEVLHHCEAEAERVLEWLAEAPSSLPATETGVPELDIVRAGDLQSRRDIALWAMNEDMDLEAEFYDAARNLWRRVRATPRRIEEIEDSETLVLDVDAVTYELALSDIRWLMPVARDPDAAGEAELADVLPFPGS